MTVGDLVRFKLDQRVFDNDGGDKRARELYPYRFEYGVVGPGPSPFHIYTSFPSRPKPVSYILEMLEVVDESR